VDLPTRELTLNSRIAREGLQFVCG